MSSGMYILILYISYDPLWVIQKIRGCKFGVCMCVWPLVFSKMGYTQRFSYSAILNGISSKSSDMPLIFSLFSDWVIVHGMNVLNLFFCHYVANIHIYECLYMYIFICIYNHQYPAYWLKQKEMVSFISFIHFLG